MNSEAREGDLIENTSGAIFDVKGLVHPQNRAVAFIRYFPDEKGKRRRNSTTYGKVYSLSKRYTLLKKRFPQYLVYDCVFDETLCEVPLKDIVKRYDPIERLQELHNSEAISALETKAVKLAETLRKEANIPWRAIGITGSILARLNTPSSDIDPIVYGSNNCRKAHSALKRLLKDEHSAFSRYSRKNLRTLFDFRSKDTITDFGDFIRTESRKAQQGKFMGTDYFVRFVKEWREIDETYGDVQYRNIGRAKIKATIADDSESIFTPCTYKIENAEVIEGTKCQSIREIVSFRGRFCEQAKIGEAVLAQGKVEHVADKKRKNEYSRLLLGNNPSNYMIIA
jgi:hypothetical protein